MSNAVLLVIYYPISIIITIFLETTETLKIKNVWTPDIIENGTQVDILQYKETNATNSSCSYLP